MDKYNSMKKIGFAIVGLALLMGALAQTPAIGQHKGGNKAKEELPREATADTTIVRSPERIVVDTLKPHNRTTQSPEIHKTHQTRPIQPIHSNNPELY